MGELLGKQRSAVSHQLSAKKLGAKLGSGSFTALPAFADR
jgi:hypothetical protein